MFTLLGKQSKWWLFPSHANDQAGRGGAIPIGSGDYLRDIPPGKQRTPRVVGATEGVCLAVNQFVGRSAWAAETSEEGSGVSWRAHRLVRERFTANTRNLWL